MRILTTNHTMLNRMLTSHHAMTIEMTTPTIVRMSAPVLFTLGAYRGGPDEELSRPTATKRAAIRCG